MHQIFRKLPVILAMAMTIGSASADPAVDTTGFHGYARVVS